MTWQQQTVKNVIFNFLSLQKTQNLTHCFVSHLFFLHSMRLSRSNNDMMFQKMLQQHLFVSIFWMFNGKAKQQYFKQWSLEKIFEGTQFKELTDINFYWNSGHSKFWLPEVRTSILVYIKMSKMRELFLAQQTIGHINHFICYTGCYIVWSQHMKLLKPQPCHSVPHCLQLLF